MKEMKIKVVSGKSQKNNEMKMHTMELASDFFKCRKCDYTVRMLVRGNTATCSQCGGTMDRC